MCGRRVSSEMLDIVARVTGFLGGKNRLGFVVYDSEIVLARMRAFRARGRHDASLHPSSGNWQEFHRR